MKNVGRSSFLIWLALAGCQAAEGPQPAEKPASTENTLLDPAPDSDGVLRVLVLHDMEGLSGQDDPRTFGAR